LTEHGVKGWLVHYRAHNEIRRPALVLVPAEYGPHKHSPPLPLVISPHGRGVRAINNSKFWGGLPGLGGPKPPGLGGFPGLGKKK